MAKLYKEYFKIDKEFFPVMDEKVFRENIGLWKKFYPHETFQNMLKTAVELLSRRKKLSMWVDGAYGTGKSHAVLTLKKLIDASDDDVREYFTRYKLDNDLLNKFLAEKNAGINLTVFLSGSAAIYNDEDLLFALTEAVEKALSEKGLVNSRIGMRQAIINWLSKRQNKDYFQAIIDEDYSVEFAGQKVDTIISNLQIFENKDLNALVEKIFKVAREQHFSALKMTVEDFCVWIKEVVEQNKLHSIFIVWDEFSEYFANCLNRITGFQTIVELAATQPFYLVPVTHQIVFTDTPQGKKLLGRFAPVCEIALPDNIAFELLGHSMERNKDNENEFEGLMDDLYQTTHDSREVVKKFAKIDDETLKGILPIHPYAALLLKNIATAYKATARSMFTFIKDDSAVLAHGFQWYIDSHSPYDVEGVLLTLDLLWGFFYDDGKNDLVPKVRNILDEYNRHADKLTLEERMVLRSILLMEAVSANVGNSIELFLPSDKNLNMAFEGTELQNEVNSCVRALAKKHVIFERNLGNKLFMYSAISKPDGGNEVETEKEKIKAEWKTGELLDVDPLNQCFTLLSSLGLRYELVRVGENSFDRKINDLRNKPKKDKIPVVIAYGINRKESAIVCEKIRKAVQSKSYEMIFVDASNVQMTEQQIDDYVENLAYAKYYVNKDGQLSKKYESDAKKVLRDWKENIEKGEMIISSQYSDEDKRVVGSDGFVEYLMNFTRKTLPNGLEQYSVIDSMWVASSMGMGVECGVKQLVSGTFRSSNEKTKLENALKDAWKIEKYWEKNPYANISKIKIAVDRIITEGFNQEGRIAIRNVYEVLKQKPFGFRPCNLTAFVMGFVLKEYVNAGLSWSDGVTTTNLDLPKMKEMVVDYLKQEMSPSVRYKDTYIVTMTDDERAFHDLSSRVFEIPAVLCTTVEAVRDRLRVKVREFAFPLWILKYCGESRNTLVMQILDNYCILANNGSSQVQKSENDCAQEIGKLYRTNRGLLAALKALVTKENFRTGMDSYLHQYRDGELVNLASEIQDDGQYLNVVKNKFTADAANWVWNQDTVNKLIDSAIVEYKIVFFSNKLLPFSNNFNDTIEQWAKRSSTLKISKDAMIAISGYSSDFKDLMQVLLTVQRNHNLYGVNQTQFLNLLNNTADEFRDFEKRQIVVFQNLYKEELAGLSDKDIQKIYDALPSMFGMEKSRAQMAVHEEVEQWNKNNKLRQLRQLWKEKTGTETPRIWSKQRGMPILFMIDDDEFDRARQMFGVLNQNHPDDKSVDGALSYFKDFRFYESMKNDSMVDAKFREKVLKDYAIIMDDLQDVKDYLSRKLASDTYDWALTPQLSNVVRVMAERNYVQKSQPVMDEIDNMPPERAKEYLKKLVKENINVGIEILKSR